MPPRSASGNRHLAIEIRVDARANELVPREGDSPVPATEEAPLSTAHQSHLCPNCCLELWSKPRSRLLRRQSRGAIRRRHRHRVDHPRRLRVLRSDNGARVRDGYSSEGTRGNARALPTHHKRASCRTNVPANDRACTRLPPLDFHGKEAVPGSSPGEGLNTCRTAYSEKSGVPPDHGGPGSSQREGAENFLQIMRCSGSAEHFPEREVLCEPLTCQRRAKPA
jgi:hypothetical protein